MDAYKQGLIQTGLTQEQADSEQWQEALRRAADETRNDPHGAEGTTMAFWDGRIKRLVTLIPSQHPNVDVIGPHEGGHVNVETFLIQRFNEVIRARDLGDAVADDDRWPGMRGVIMTAQQHAEREFHTAVGENIEQAEHRLGEEGARDPEQYENAAREAVDKVQPPIEQTIMGLMNPSWRNMATPGLPAPQNNSPRFWDIIGSPF